MSHSVKPARFCFNRSEKGRKIPEAALTACLSATLICYVRWTKWCWTPREPLVQFSACSILSISQGQSPPPPPLCSHSGAFRGYIKPFFLPCQTCYCAVGTLHLSVAFIETVKVPVVVLVPGDWVDRTASGWFQLEPHKSFQSCCCCFSIFLIWKCIFNQ